MGLNCIRSLCYAIYLLLTVIPWFMGVLLVTLLARRSSWPYHVASHWLLMAVRGAKWILGIRYEVMGYEHLPLSREKGCVILVKHQSTYETLLMPALIPRRLAYVFKKELLRIPFFGWSMACLEMIHIDRSKGTQALMKIIEQGRRLLLQGRWVVMFPEGTRVPRGQVGNYRSSGVRLAIEVGVPVIPVAVTSGRCWPIGQWIKKSGVVQVSIGEPIETEGKKTEEVMEQVKAFIESEMRRLDASAYELTNDVSGAL